MARLHVAFPALFLALWWLVYCLGLPFSHLYFDWAGLNTVILPVIHHAEPASTLASFRYYGLYFTETELMHWQDVQTLLQLRFWLVWLSLPILLVVLYLYRRYLPRLCAYSLLFAIGIVCAATLSTLIWGWKPMTHAFHSMIFDNMHWKLPTDSLTITLYPRSSMQQGAIAVLIAWLLGLFAFFLCVRLSRSRQNLR